MLNDIEQAQVSVSLGCNFAIHQYCQTFNQYSLEQAENPSLLLQYNGEGRPSLLEI